MWKMLWDPADRALIGKEPEEASQWREKNTQHDKKGAKSTAGKTGYFLSTNYGETPGSYEWVSFAWIIQLMKIAFSIKYWRGIKKNKNGESGESGNHFVMSSIILFSRLLQFYPIRSRVIFIWMINISSPDTSWPLFLNSNFPCFLFFFVLISQAISCRRNNVFNNMYLSLGQKNGNCHSCILWELSS